MYMVLPLPLNNEASKQVPSHHQDHQHCDDDGRQYSQRPARLELEQRPSKMQIVAHGSLTDVMSDHMRA